HGRDIGVYSFVRQLDNFKDTILDSKEKKCITNLAKKAKFLSGLTPHIYQVIRAFIDLDPNWDKMVSMFESKESANNERNNQLQGNHTNHKHQYSRRQVETINKTTIFSPNNYPNRIKTNNYKLPA